MRNIKINEEQDKGIRNIINEFLQTNPNAGANLGQLQTAVGNSSKAKPTMGIEFADNVSNNERLNMAAKGAQATKGEIHTELKTPGDPETDVTVEPKAKNTVTAESVIISKKQLDEIRLKKLKENSEVVKIKNFLK